LYSHIENTTHIGNCNHFKALSQKNPKYRSVIVEKKV
jgi:hypothetical protein